MTTTTLAITTSTGAVQNVLVVLLPDGTAAPAHRFVDTNGNPISPALDATAQSLIAAIEALTVALPPTITTAPYKGMNEWQAGSVSAMELSGVIDMDSGANSNIVWNAGSAGAELDGLVTLWMTSATTGTPTASASPWHRRLSPSPPSRRMRSRWPARSTRPFTPDSFCARSLRPGGLFLRSEPGADSAHARPR